MLNLTIEVARFFRVLPQAFEAQISARGLRNPHTQWLYNAIAQALFHVSGNSSLRYSEHTFGNVGGGSGPWQTSYKIMAFPLGKVGGHIGRLICSEHLFMSARECRALLTAQCACR